MKDNKGYEPQDYLTGISGSLNLTDYLGLTQELKVKSEALDYIREHCNIVRHNDEVIVSLRCSKSEFEQRLEEYLMNE